MKLKHNLITKSLTAGAFALACLGSASATTLTSNISMDNGFEVYLSTADNTAGTSFGSLNNWPVTSTNSISSLVSGTDYYLHVWGYDQGGIAGFLGEFTLSGTDHKFSNNTQNLLTNTTDWQGNAAGFNGTYSSVSSLGNNGVGPWYTRPNISASATWIWFGNADTNNNSYFTTKISATASPAVPDSSTTLILIGLSLGSFAFFRRKLA